MSPNLRIGLPVIAFGLLVLILVLASNGSGFPGEGTPLVDIHATNTIRTQDAANALLPIPAVTGTAQARLRAAWTFDPAPGRVTALVRSRDAILIGGDAGLFQATADGALSEVLAEDAASAELRQEAGQWVSDQAAAALPDAVSAMCGSVDAPGELTGAVLTGAVLSEDGKTAWLACGDRLIHAYKERQFWFSGPVGPDEGLPAAPTGVLLLDTDGRLWVGLANGLGILTPQTS
jgi:hypothetical protein